MMQLEMSKSRPSARHTTKIATRLKKSPNVNITVVVVGKRHHIRFYPLKSEEWDRWGNNNTYPGTFVDKLVTSPYYQDFYLQSHSGIKNTARPAHYFCLTDEIKDLTSMKLRDLVSFSILVFILSPYNLPSKHIF
jgi:eukaryotic translation initiation factor 2C